MQRLRKNHRPAKGLKYAFFFGALAMSASAIPFAGAQALDDNALPTGGNVVNGSATLDYNGSQLDIYQGTDRAVINWDSFNIGVNASTQFHQPSSSSIVVNRVVGDNQDPTQILGTLRANGRVFVLDRNGVIFGHDSIVDVGSIVVSTGTIDDAAFMAGDNVLSIDDINTGGEIVNNGTITVAEAGLAAFVAPTVANNGIIQAKMGKIALASGTKATIDLYGDKLVEVATDLPLDNASIKNTGTIKAEGGTVLITASAAKDIVDSVINMDGVTSVASATEKAARLSSKGQALTYPARSMLRVKPAAAKFWSEVSIRAAAPCSAPRKQRSKARHRLRPILWARTATAAK